MEEHEIDLVLEQSIWQPQVLDDIEHSILQISWLCQRQFMHLLDSEQFRLTVPQFYTLQTLHAMSGHCKMSTLAEATHQSAASLTGVVDRLLEKQLVERTRHEKDRRQVMVVVTPRGRELLEEIKLTRQAQMQQALTYLESHDVAVLIELLEQVHTGMLRAAGQDENTNSVDDYAHRK